MPQIRFLKKSFLQESAGQNPTSIKINKRAGKLLKIRLLVAGQRLKKNENGELGSVVFEFWTVFQKPAVITSQ